ncbi:MAG: hypothetical protein V2A66_03205 [Pseudomonadota bacterium]
MTDFILKPKPLEPEPFSERWGLTGSYTLKFPIATAISEGGLGHCFGLGLKVAENFDSATTFEAGACFGNTEMKLLPSADAPGTTAQGSYWTIHAGFGKERRMSSLYGENGRLSADLMWGVTPSIGGGSLSVSQPGFDGKSSGVVEVNTNYKLTGEIRPSGRFVIRIGPEFNQGVLFAGEGSEFNRMLLSLMIVAGLGWSDASARSGRAADRELGGLEIFQGMYATIHRFISGYISNSALADQQEALKKYGLLTDGGDRGASGSLPILQGASALLGGMDTTLSTSLHAGTGWFLGMTGLRGAGGVGLMLSGGDAGKASGTTDILTLVRPIGLLIGGVESPSKRHLLPREVVDRREMYVNLVSYLVNSGLMLIGAAAGSGVLMDGANGANIQIATTPDPLDRNMAPRTDVAFIPYSARYGLSGNTKSGGLSGVIIHKDWAELAPNFRLFSSVSFLTPLYTDKQQNTEVDSALGIEWKTTYTRLSLGLDTKMIFGGGDEAKAGIGGVLGFDIVIPINGGENGSGLVLGARGMCHKLFSDGSQCQVGPHAGASFHF